MTVLKMSQAGCGRSIPVLRIVKVRRIAYLGLIWISGMIAILQTEMQGSFVLCQMFHNVKLMLIKEKSALMKAKLHASRLSTSSLPL